MRIELGEPVLAICARSAIPTGYLLRYRFKLLTIVTREGVHTIKVYAVIATLALFAREPSVKAKNATVTTGIEHTPSHARGVRVSAVSIGACEMAVYILS